MRAPRSFLFRLMVQFLATTAILGSIMLSSAHAQFVRGRTPGQMKKVLNDALKQKKRVVRLRAYVEKGTVVFDVTLAPNPEEYEWLVLLNLTQAQYAKAQSEYAQTGYTVANSTALSANSQVFHSAVWLKTVESIGSLVLPDKPLPESGPVVENLKSVDGLMRAFIKANNASGATVAIARDGQIVYERAFGWANVPAEKELTPDTPMRIASISKSITAVAIMQLVEQKKLSLHAPVVPLLKKKGFRGISRIEDPNWDKMTVHHLLRHTAGFKPSNAFQTSIVAQDLKLTRPASRKDIIRYYFRQKLASEPGKEFRYSNFGYSLLGRVIETVSSRIYGPYIQDNILGPAEMGRTKVGRTLVKDRPRNEAWYHMQKEEIGAAFWSTSVTKVGRGGKGVDGPDIVRKPDGAWNLEAMDSYSGWISTAGDLVRFVSAMESKTAPLLKPETREKMLESLAPDGNDYYACGWFVRPSSDKKRIWHSGAFNGTSSLLVRRADGIAWAVLFNTDISSSNERPLSGLLEPFMDQTLSGIEW